MKIFFNTEFTGLHKDTTLISIGLVDENGRTFYGEFTDYDKSQCDNWIKENVINHLVFNRTDGVFNYDDDNTWMNVKGNKEFVAEKLREWLLPYYRVQLVSDVCHYDMVLFIDLFGSAWDLPSCINPSCHDINQDIAEYCLCTENEAFDISREELVNKHTDPIDGLKHNALYDAKVIKKIYEIIHY